ncbi:MAG TPA: hypothetical protein VG692_13360 [Gemmatimonadales bacterium]|nr:hypothetical protein [Gemmatimonadales bacterium]
MSPEAWHNLLLNLKLQLLGLPNLAKWGLLTFAGIVVLREAITFAWNVRSRRKVAAGNTAVPRRETASAPEPAALPAPDPFGDPLPRRQELDTIRLPTPPAGQPR